MKKFKVIITFFCTLFFVSIINAQYPYLKFDRLFTENLKLEHGLSQNTIFSITQDAHGFMWFGTFDGLNRFDGYDFKIFRSSDTLENLSSDIIYCLFVDNSGKLWVGTDKGLNYYDEFNQRFNLFSSSLYPQLETASIRVMVQDKYGFLWVGTNIGLFQIEPSTKFARHFTYKKDMPFSLSSNRIRCLLIDDEGLLWICTNSGLDVLHIEKGLVRNYSKSQSLFNGLNNPQINTLILQNDSVMWIGTSEGLLRHHKNSGKDIIYRHSLYNKESLSHNDVRSIYVDVSNKLWIGTYGGGLNIFEPNTNGFKAYHAQAEATALSNDYINTIFRDKSGMLWIGTRKGISKIDRTPNQFFYYSLLNYDNSSFSSNYVWSIMQDSKKNIWIGTENGLFIVDIDKNISKIVRNNPFSNNSLSNNDVRTVIEEQDGSFWIATNGGGLNKYYPTSNRFIRLVPNAFKNSISNEFCWDICKDDKGNLWIASFDGLNKMDIKTGLIKIYRNEETNPNSLSNNFIFDLYLDSYKQLWVATNNGLNVYRPESDDFLVYKHDPKSTNSLSSNKIFNIIQDSDSLYWIGTNNKGLNRFDRRKNSYKHYTTADGLANDVIYGILEDDNDHLWLSTNLGITRFNKKQERFTNYDIRDGLQSYEFNLGAVYKNKQGELFFGGVNGFNSFFPQQIIENRYVPQVIVTSFQVLGAPFNKAIKDGDTIILPHSDNYFSFNFSSIDFSKPYKNRFAYMLENYDKSWIYCSAERRFAEYSKVPPGRYKIRIKCSNSDGIWNDLGIVIYLVIVPPWYRTLWFYLAVGALLLLISGFSAFSIIQRVRKKQEFEQRMLDAKMQLFDLEQKALRLQMNPHFLFNSLNSIQGFILNNDVDKAVKYLAKFAQLMRLILTNTRESFVPFSDEMKALTYYLEIEKLRFDNKFDYTIAVDKLIDTDFIAIPPMILQPYIENAILHGLIHLPDKGLLNIKFLQSADVIQVEIIDNGIGRKKSAEIRCNSGLNHKSQGMRITQERLDILKQQTSEQVTIEVVDLFDNSGNAAGTKIIINLPFKEIL